jgi:hypothetical protein
MQHGRLERYRVVEGTPCTTAHRQTCLNAFSLSAMHSTRVNDDLLGLDLAFEVVLNPSCRKRLRAL